MPSRQVDPGQSAFDSQAWFARAPAAFLAPFTYLEIVVAVPIGQVMFGTLPDAVAILGMVLIIAAGLVVARPPKSRVEHDG